MQEGVSLQAEAEDAGNPDGTLDPFKAQLAGVRLGTGVLQKSPKDSLNALLHMIRIKKYESESLMQAFLDAFSANRVFFIELLSFFLNIFKKSP